MQPQTQFFDLWLRTMSDLTKVSLQHGLRLQSRQLELLTALQIDFWNKLWRSAAGQKRRRS